MRRITLFLLLFALVLAGCGGSSGEVTVPEPPNTTAFEKSDSEQINKIIEGWQAQVPTTLTQNQIKQETIEQKVYESKASLQEVVDFYTQQISSANGWTGPAWHVHRNEISLTQCSMQVGGPPSP